MEVRPPTSQCWWSVVIAGCYEGLLPPASGQLLQMLFDLYRSVSDSDTSSMPGAYPVCNEYFYPTLHTGSYPVDTDVRDASHTKGSQGLPGA